MLRLAQQAMRRDALLAPRLLNADGSVQRSAHPVPGTAAALLPALVRTRGCCRAGCAWPPIRGARRRRAGWAGRSPPRVAARTEVLRRLGPFDPGAFLFFEDMELCLRAAAAGVPTELHPEIALRHAGGHSTRPAYAGEPHELLAQRRREVVGARLGGRALALDDLAQALTFATRAIAHRGRGREVEQLRAAASCASQSCYIDVTVAVADPRILPGARRAIERYGWQDATLERIAAEAGLSRMTLHRRGVTRHGILSALASSIEDQYRAALWPALTAPGDARARLEQALEALCDVVEENLALVAALSDRPRNAIFHEDSEPGTGGALTRRTFTEPVERLLRDGAADGSLRAVDDPAETATVLFNLISWTYRHLRGGHGWSPERTQARRAVDRAGGHRGMTGELDRGLLARLSTGHAAADLCQGAVPALLPFFVIQRGWSYAARGPARPGHDRRLVDHPAAVRRGGRSPRDALAHARRRAARGRGHRALRASFSPTASRSSSSPCRASASRRSIPRGRASPITRPDRAAAPA